MSPESTIAACKRCMSITMCQQCVGSPHLANSALRAACSSGSRLRTLNITILTTKNGNVSYGFCMVSVWFLYGFCTVSVWFVDSCRQCFLWFLYYIMHLHATIVFSATIVFRHTHHNILQHLVTPDKADDSDCSTPDSRGLLLSVITSSNTSMILTKRLLGRF